MYLSNIVFAFLIIFISTGASAQTVDNRLELTVALDGSGDFTTIQDAVNHVRDHAEKRVVIHIRAGVYNEKVVIPSFKRNITLKGEGSAQTIIRFDDYSGKPFRGIDVTGDSKFSTYTSYTVLIDANDCSLEDLTIENTAGPVGQAVALHTEGDRIVIRNCRILGNQDTLYLAKAGTRIYLENCFINGTTDFIFGAATAYFFRCRIESLRNSYITAASTTAEEPYGFVFESCQLTAKEEDVNKVYLGRPWRPHAKTVFINTDMGGHIIPEGWHPWPGDKNFPHKEKTAFYAEYGSHGTGAENLSKRVAWSHQLTKSALKKYSREMVLNGWNPTTTIYLIGDSTVADYSLEDDYDSKRYPLVGWGQMFQPFFVKDSLKHVEHLLGNVEQVKVDDRAKGGRSTRTFFQEGRWTAIYQSLQKGDIVMMQFGHNDGAENKPERYVDIQAYKEFLRLFITQTRQKGALPILLTPVARNYPWRDGKLQNVHGEYPQAVKEVAIEMAVKLIDLNELSMAHFTKKGQDYVTANYFMNIPAGRFKAYPEGQRDNTHFQIAGGKAVAQLVFNAMKGL